MKTKKILFAVLFIAFTHNIAYAQIPNWTWVKTTGGNSYDHGNDIAIDKSNNIYVTGDFSPPSIILDSINLTCMSGYHAFITKLNANANVLWAKCSSGLGNAVGQSIAIDTNGNVYAAGYFYGPYIIFENDTLKNSGGADIFIVKYSSGGNFLWARNTGESVDDKPLGISVDITGNIYLTGYFDSNTLAFGIDTLVRAGGESFFIAAYDENGNALWARNSANNGRYNLGTGITTDPTGNIYVTGWFDGDSLAFDTMVLKNMNANYTDIFIVKYDSNGQILWAKSIGGYEYEFVEDIIVDETGSIYFTGYFRSDTVYFGSNILSKKGGIADILVAKCDVNGNFIWASCTGDSLGETGNAITVDKNHNVYLTGYFYSTSLTFGNSTLLNFGIMSLFVAKYDSIGNAKWGINADGTGYDYGLGIVTDPTGGIYVTGAFDSPVITFNYLDYINPNPGYEDIFIAKLSNSVGIDKIIRNGNLSVNPNPASGRLNIVFNAPPKTPNHINIYLCDITGRIILEKTFSSVVGENKIEIDVSGVAKGVYFLKVDSQSVAAKVVIE